MKNIFNGNYFYIQFKVEGRYGVRKFNMERVTVHKRYFARNVKYELPDLIFIKYRLIGRKCIEHV